MRRRTVGRGSARTRVIEPAAGANSPAIAWSRVDLPEPLGPTSDVMPGADVEVGGVDHDPAVA